MTRQPYNEVFCDLYQKITSDVLSDTLEIWVSNNIPGCDEHNKPIHDKYRHRIHHLYPVW